MGKISADECMELVSGLVCHIDNRGLTFDLIIGFSTGGLVVAAMVAKKLEGMNSSKVIGLPVKKNDRVYLLDDRYATLGDVRGARVLLVDDASNSGGLLKGGAMDLWERGADQVVTAALIANERGAMPDLCTITCVGEPPKFFWE